MQQLLEPRPFVPHQRQGDPQPRTLDAQAPREHTIRLQEDAERRVWAKCSCGFRSAPWYPGYGHPTLVCGLLEIERESARWEREFVAAGGPVE